MSQCRYDVRGQTWSGYELPSLSSDIVQYVVASSIWPTLDWLELNPHLIISFICPIPPTNFFQLCPLLVHGVLKMLVKTIVLLFMFIHTWVVGGDLLWKKGQFACLYIFIITYWLLVLKTEYTCFVYQRVNIMPSLYPLLTVRHYSIILKRYLENLSTNYLMNNL